MKTLTAKDAKYGFGRLIDIARAKPVTIGTAEEIGMKADVAASEALSAVELVRRS